MPSDLVSYILAIAVILLTSIVLRRQVEFMRLGYPVATTRIPVLGSAIEFGTRGLKFLQEKKKELGNVFVVDLLVLRFHFVLGAKNISQFYKAPNNVLDFLGAVPDLMPELVEDAWDKNPDFQAHGHALVLKGFNQKERLDHVYKIIIQEADKWSKMEKIDIFDESSRMVILVTLRFILGDEICEEKGDYLANIYDQLEKDLANPLVMTLRPLPTPPYTRLKKNRDILLDTMKQCVQKRIDNQNQSKVKNDLSFLQFLMDEAGEEHAYQYAFLCLGIILATRTNTGMLIQEHYERDGYYWLANVFAWSICHVVTDTKVMEKIQTELTETGCTGTNGQQLGDSTSNPYPIAKFEYLDAVMKETVRKYSNFMQFRKVACDGGWECEPGKIIPKGALVCISPAESHHDPAIFDDPYKFVPERWLVDDYWARRAREMSFVQWGFLRHRCYGEKWAQQFDKVCWARLFSKFNVTAYKGQEMLEPLWGSGFGTSFPVDGEVFWVSVKEKKQESEVSKGKSE